MDRNIGPIKIIKNMHAYKYISKNIGHVELIKIGLHFNIWVEI
jgi:hypothetical protein